MEDLSGALRGRTGGGLTGGASMSAAGGISTHPAGTGPGSESEATSGVTATEPGPVIPELAGYRHDHATGNRDGSPWATAGGGPWADAYEPDPAPGQGGPGRWRQR